VRYGFPPFQCAEIGRFARELIGNVGENNAPVNGSGPRVQTKVEVFRVVKGLDLLKILCVEPFYVHEDVVVDLDTMPILTRGAAIVGKIFEAARFQGWIGTEPAPTTGTWPCAGTRSGRANCQEQSTVVSQYVRGR